MNTHYRPIIALSLSFWLALAAGADADETPRILGYNRDVRPILSEYCFQCHGPDSPARQADLRLDRSDSATLDRDGHQAIAPGNPEGSELIRRIFSTDPAVAMPPADHPRRLSEQHKELLRAWIEQGAKYEQHWAYLPLSGPTPPRVQNDGWPRNPIDRFVLARLEEQQLDPLPEADRATLLRRVCLDLTGLPPSLEMADEFLADPSPDAYERLVERLLNSPRYGERQALDWLDAARYADSGGYQGDIFRTMWPWRDWAIAAFNGNMPFDQFTIEQLAGDLLPEPTRNQLIATGFHRNHRINDEDGIIPEEFRVEYVADRAETTAQVWLGQTIGCARCHDHKYDPITQRNYYEFFAYFNSIDESGRGNGNAPPILRLTTPEQEAQAADFARQLEVAQAELNALTAPEGDPSRVALNEKIAALTANRDAALAAAPVTMILRELPEPRSTFILTRGAYDRPADPVSPGVPEVFPHPPDGTPANRLSLARWLVSPDHPLTARVIVNRYWTMHFGSGLVRTPEDFGTQGQLPMHPELLDWLAAEFIRSGWDIKGLHRLIVTSATYRQTSRAEATSFLADPDNRFLARGPRFRLPAELIRDQALAAGGLLDTRIGGPSVRPYQPDGLWRELSTSEPEYNGSHGIDLYRRSLYTFWRRTIPPPTMAAFDAPSREICTVRRGRTNTPLQALALMNDPQFVEAARSLAQSVLLNAGVPAEDSAINSSDSSANNSSIDSAEDSSNNSADNSEDARRLDLAFRRVLVRSPSPAEREFLNEALRHFRKNFTDQPDAAAQFLTVGESLSDSRLAAPELAAWTALALTILNLDEAVTRE